MSHKIDTIAQPSSGTRVPVGTKVTENAVITGSEKACQCHDGEENTLVRQYKAMLAKLEEAKNKFVDAAFALLKFQFEEATEEDIYAMFDEDEQTTNS